MRHYQKHYLNAKKRGDLRAMMLQRSTKSQEWFTYFVEAERIGLIKIGRTRDLPKRFATLQAENADTIKLLTLVTESELTLHRRFAHLRAHGEWFRPDAEMRAYIRAANVEYETKDPENSL